MQTTIDFPPMGVGTNVWGHGGKPSPSVAAVFYAALDAGITLIDTAELYQGGGSERNGPAAGTADEYVLLDSVITRGCIAVGVRERGDLLGRIPARIAGITSTP